MYTKFGLMAICISLAAVSPAQIPAATTSTPMVSQEAMGGAVDPADADFVKNAAIGGLFEVQSSQIATTASQTEAVKTFAQRMITDHSKANQELMTLAASKQIPVPKSLDEKHAQMLQRLQKAEGDAFDKAYSRMQNKAHMEAVALFEKASTSAKDPDLKNFAAKTLPILKEHHQLAGSLPGAGEGKKAKKAKNTE